MKRFLGSTFGVLVAISVISPLLWVFVSALKTGDAIVSSPWSLPTQLQFKNFSEAWVSASIGTAFQNSLIATLGTLIILIPIGASAAYALSRYQFFGNRLLFGFFLGGMMFPNFLIVVPLFIEMNQIGLLNSLLGLVLAYVAYSLPFTIFVLSGFFQVLPHELAEAAMVDGCGHFKIYAQVLLPLVRPGIIVVAIFNAIGLWNEYPLALVLLTDPKHQTLPITLSNLAMNQQYQGNWGALFAGLTIVIAPVLVIYLIFSDRIHDTMIAGAVKG